MRTTGIACRLLALGFALGVTAGCSGGGSNGGVISVGLVARFTASTTPVAPDLVRIRSVAASGNTITLGVSLGGPSTSADLYSFAFDVVLGDTDVLEYVSGSAAAGGALTASGGQTISVQAAQVGDRVVVGLTKLGGGGGNGVTATETDLVRLTFRVREAGASTLVLDGTVSPGNPTGDPQGLDSQGDPVVTLSFDAASATVAGS